MVQNLGSSLSSSEGCRIYYRGPVYIPYKRGPRICWSQSSCQTSARSPMISFPSSADDKTECYLSFLTDFKNWHVKSTTAMDSVETSHSRYICVFHRGTEKKKSNMHDIHLFLINWHDRVGKKQFTTISYFLKILCLKMVLEISD